MRKMAVGPGPASAIDLGKPVAENIEAIADTFGRRPMTSPRSCSTVHATTT